MRDDTIYLHHMVDAISTIARYLDVDVGMVWTTARDDLPILLGELEGILGDR